MTDRPIPITEESLRRMPKKMARRLRPALRPIILKEFEEWVDDMGYQAHMSSPMLRQFLYESFIGGWGARVRQMKRDMKRERR